jgi:hypothetical protein
MSKGKSSPPSENSTPQPHLLACVSLMRHRRHDMLAYYLLLRLFGAGVAAAAACLAADADVAPISQKQLLALSRPINGPACIVAWIPPCLRSRTAVLIFGCRLRSAFGLGLHLPGRDFFTRTMAASLRPPGSKCFSSCMQRVAIRVRKQRCGFTRWWRHVLRLNEPDICCLGLLPSVARCWATPRRQAVVI